MKRIIGIATWLWVVSFAVSFTGRTVGRIADAVCITAGCFFVAELVIAYRRSESNRAFLRDNILEIVTLVPVFRGLRLLRLSRRLKRLFFVLDTIIEGIDILVRVKVRSFVRKIQQRYGNAI